MPKNTPPPSWFECAAFSLDVYRDVDRPPLPDGWSIFADCPPEHQVNGYFGSAYIACIDEKYQAYEIVIAHRGTTASIADAIQDFLVFLKEAPTTFQSAAIPFVEYVITLMKTKFPDSSAASCSISQHTGHSLGAVLAELCLAKYYPMNGITFECPGSKPIIQRLISQGVLSPNALEQASQLLCTNYADINAINTCNEQLDPDARPGYVPYTYDQDSGVPEIPNQIYYFQGYTVDNQHKMINFYNAWKPGRQIELKQERLRGQYWPVTGFEAGFEYYKTYENFGYYWDEYIQSFWDAHPAIHSQYNNDEYQYQDWYVNQSGYLFHTSPASAMQPLEQSARKPAQFTVTERLALAKDDDERLYVAVYNGEHELARSLLARGANPNTRHGVEKIPLISIAVLMADLKMLQLLVEFHADVDLTDRKKNTALHHIAYQRSQDAEHYAEPLLMAGANFQLKNFQNRTPIEIYQQYGALRVNALRKTFDRTLQKRHMPIYSFPVVRNMEFRQKTLRPRLPFGATGQLAALALDVYRDSSRPDLPDGWVIYEDYVPQQGDEGYFGCCYVHNNGSYIDQIVFAHRGTVIAEIGNILGDLETALGLVPAQFSSAANFVLSVMQKLINDPLSKNLMLVNHVGHSLGAIISELFAASQLQLPSAPGWYSTFSNSFESPGSKPIIQNLIQIGVLPKNALQQVSVYCAICNNLPNAINTFNDHVVPPLIAWQIPVNYAVLLGPALNIPQKAEDNFYYLAGYTILDQHKIQTIYNFLNILGGNYTLGFPKVMGLQNAYDYFRNYDQNTDYWNNYIKFCWEMHPEIQQKYQNNFNAYQQDFIQENLVRNMQRYVVQYQAPIRLQIEADRDGCTPNCFGFFTQWLRSKLCSDSESTISYTKLEEQKNEEQEQLRL